jgi:hypothetical protein
MRRTLAFTVSLVLLAGLIAASPGHATEISDSLAVGATEVGGYGEMVLQAPEARREDGARSHLLPNADFLRAALEVKHRFSRELRVTVEMEWEHGGIGEAPADSVRGLEEKEGGEATVEYAILEWSCSPRLTLHGGKLLVPSGFVNRAHEPDEFRGALRPDVETLIIPSTWSALGVGASGELPHGLAWTLDVLEGLDATRFSAAERFRHGRQDGAQALLTHPAFAARLDWRAAEGVTLGGSIVTGDAWQGEQPDSALHPRTWVNEAHAHVERGGFDLRALYATALLWDHVALTRALGVAHTDAALGKRGFGGEIEASYDVRPLVWPHADGALRPYVRFELTDTQDGVGAIGTENPLYHRTNLTVGLEYSPVHGVVIKADRQQRHHEDDSGVSQWNVALGYGF